MPDPGWPVQTSTANTRLPVCTRLPAIERAPAALAGTLLGGNIGKALVSLGAGA